MDAGEGSVHGGQGSFSQVCLSVGFGWMVFLRSEEEDKYVLCSVLIRMEKKVSRENILQ